MSEANLPPRHGGYRPKPAAARPVPARRTMTVKPPSGKGGGSRKRAA